MKKIIFVLIILLFLAGAVSWRIYKIRTTETAESIDEIQKETGIPVRTFVIEPETVKETIPISGSISPFQQVIIAPNVSERLVKLHAQAGDKVEKGQVLAELDDTLSRLQVREAEVNLALAREKLQRLKNGNRPEEIAMAQAALDQARHNLDLLNIEYERQKNLYAENATTAQALDDVTERRNAARAQLESAKANYELMKKGPREEDITIAENQVHLAEVALEQARKHLADHTLKAPIDGVVSIKMAEEGDMIDFMQPVYELYDINPVYLDIDVSEIYRPKIRENLAVNVTVDALPGQTFTGTIDQINPAADTRDRSFRTRILIDNDTFGLQPGMFARAHIVVRQLDNALMVPDDAINEDNGSTYVFLVAGDMTAQKQPVTTGPRFKNRVALVEGVNPGDEVITLSIDLKTGDKLKLEGEEEEPPSEEQLTSNRE